MQNLPRIGDKFGRWTILGEFRQHGARHYTYVKIACECGTVKWRELSLLRSRNRQGYLQGCIVCRHKAHGAQTIGSYMRAIYKHICPWMTIPHAEFLATQNCFYCGAPPLNRVNLPRKILGNFCGRYQGLDEVVYGEGHGIKNILPCCIACNKAKGNQSLKDFCVWYNRRRQGMYLLFPSKIIKAAIQCGEHLLLLG